jgi:hypothetical protein
MLVKLVFDSVEKSSLFEDTFLKNENTFRNTYIHFDSLNKKINIKFKNYLEGLNFVNLCHEAKFCKDYGIVQLDGSIYHHFIPCDKDWCVDSNIQR